MLKNKTASLPWMILKGIAALLIAFLLLYTLLFTVGFVAEGDGISQADLISWCEGSYYDRDFPQLYETLTLFDLHGNEDFAIYWEAVEGCQAYEAYIQWQRAAGLGIEGAQEKAAESYARLEALATDPEFAQNARLLEEFLQSAQAIR